MLALRAHAHQGTSSRLHAPAPAALALDVPDVESDPLRLQAKSVLRPEFLLVSNGRAQASEQIVRGNERVLGARLADAEFFLAVDRRDSSVNRRESLHRVTFAEGLGSLRQRCERIEGLERGRNLSVQVILSSQLLP